MAMWKGVAVLASIMPRSMGAFCGPQVKGMVDALNTMRGTADMISWDQRLAAQAQQQLNGTCNPEIQNGESHYQEQLGWSLLNCNKDLSKAAREWNKGGKEWDGIRPAIELIGCGVADCPFKGKRAYFVICKYDFCGDCQSNRDPYGGVNTTLPEDEEEIGDTEAGIIGLIFICLCCCGGACCCACVVKAVQAKPTEAKPAAESHKLLQRDQETGDDLLVGHGESDGEPKQKQQHAGPTSEGVGRCCFQVMIRILCKLLPF